MPFGLPVNDYGRKVVDMRESVRRLLASIVSFGKVFSVFQPKTEAKARCRTVEPEPDELIVVDTEPYLDKGAGTNHISVDDEDRFYSKFEEIFRGSKEIIKTRLAKYVEYVQQAYKLTNKDAYFLDIGCGRGEFLELLHAAKVPVKGIDINEIECEALTKKGFDVHLGDCNNFLEEVPSNFIVGVLAFQVIEHFDPEYVQDFLKLSYEKIAPNGVIILETVNPKCNPALSNFFLDITHVRPYPPETVKFLLEWHGFKDICMIYSSPCSKEFRIKNIKECNYMDFGVIAWKK